MDNRAVLRSIFDKFLDSLGVIDHPEDFELTARKNKIISRQAAKQPVERAISIGRVYEQLEQMLYEQDMWSYISSLYFESDGKLASIVAQGGKLYSVPLTVSDDNVSMGEWTRVEETYTPIEQSFRVLRQKDGKYRWTCIAGTTILNRVGQIDSADLFDSFIKRAEETGEYPRLDFYHLGRSNPKMWDFGTADFLAREGVCYIASGTFDEGHPLAEAVIRACEANPGIWGNSIEFYSLAQPEVILADPELKVSVYREGKNTRISVVLEEDAAGLFTTIGVVGEVERTMDQKTKDKLALLYGDNVEGLNSFLSQFEENVDGVNRTVKDENLIHRATDGDEATADETTENEEEGNSEFVLDDSAISEIVSQVVQNETFRAMVSRIEEVTKLVGELVVEREKDKKEITRLNQQIEQLSKEEDVKKTEYLQDLPRGKRTHVTHRPRNMNDPELSANDMSSIANRNMSKVSVTGRY